MRDIKNEKQSKSSFTFIKIFKLLVPCLYQSMEVVTFGFNRSFPNLAKVSKVAEATLQHFDNFFQLVHYGSLGPLGGWI